MSESPKRQREVDLASYLDSTGRDDLLGGGTMMVPVETSFGTFHVWTKRMGNHPTMKILLLHGGPGMTHEYLECFDSYVPAAGIEYIYYDQLGSFFSDKPEDPELLEVDRFVEEVEQVREARELDSENFYLYGQSWGGILAMEYALKYQRHLKGLIISNMMASIPAYNDYAESALMPAMDPEVLEEIQAMEAEEDYDNPRYMELLIPYHYEEHVLRMPANAWPNPVNRAFEHANMDVYIPMQGPSELGARGKLLDWDCTDDLSKIEVPTLVIGGTYDTMDPAHLRWMAEEVQRGRYWHCPNGSHLAMYDDQQVYFEGLIQFVHDVDAGSF